MLIGVFKDPDAYGKTIYLALKLHGKTQNVILITDKGYFKRIHLIICLHYQFTQ